MNKVLNVGFIGLGGFVQGNHLPNAAKNPHFHVKAICDIKTDILDTVNAQYHPDFATTDYVQLCRRDDIDLVVIGTSPHFRVEPIQAACENGKSIYVEKPMSLGFDDSREIVRLVRAHQARLMVGFNRPYSQIMQDTRRLFRQIRKGPTLAAYRIIGENLLWPQFLQDQIAAGTESTIVHELTHIFDLFNWLIDKDPLRIFAVGGRADNHILTIQYPDDINVVILSGSCGTEGYTKESLEIFSDNKTIVMDHFLELRTAQIPGVPPSTLYPRKYDKDQPGQLVDMATHRKQLHEWRRQLTDQEIAVGYYYSSRPDADKGHYQALDFMYDLITNDKPAVTNEYRGALATLMALQAITSLNTGQPVDLDFRSLSL